MVNQYLGEIKLFGRQFRPFAVGILLRADCSSISQNTALFSLLGTTYGGNGTSNFALPNLQSRTICGLGGANVIGEESGEETVTISISQYPAHVHAFNVSNTFGLAGQPTNLHYLAATRANPPPPPPPPAPAATAGGRRPQQPPSTMTSRSPVHGRLPRRGLAAQQSEPYLGHELQHRPDGRFPVEELTTRGSSTATESSGEIGMVEEYLGAVKLLRRQLRDRRATHSAPGNSCRSSRTPRCSRSSERPYGGNGVQTFRCRTCAAGCRSARATARACRHGARRERRGRERRP